MKFLTVSVLLFMGLALSVSEGASVAEAEVSVAENGAAPPAEETVETVPEEPAQNLPESPEFGAKTLLIRSQGDCSFGWYGHQGRCYQFVNQADTWINAQQYCIGIGANLASARNPREYIFLQDLVDEIGRGSQAWLGGFYLQNTWLWVDGEGFYYQNWDFQITASSHPCLYLQKRVGWSNTICYSTRYPFVCVKRSC
ncbi:snaclec coagulation factor IX-binding protein subunit A-like [Conger conger]|uniref:snaclec coagulation factor IX-binding protein subunit A-like n=1 Tax=Conger conger TaxID=82655 RepID=UPI002A5A14D6|nr:snaclec coagulation factor IX-binding protein subunit A-like [Conger conger]